MSNEQVVLTDQDRRGAIIDTLLSLQEHPGWAVLMHQLYKDAEDSKLMLVKTDPNDADKIRTLQNAVERLYYFEQTPYDMIQEAHNEEMADELAAEANAEIAEEEQDG